MSPSAGMPSVSGVICSQLFSMSLPSLISWGIHSLLERLYANTFVGIDKQLTFVAQLDIQVGDLLNHVNHFVSIERRADLVANAGHFIAAAAKGDLIKLLAFFIHTKNTDVANMVMATGVHAARDIQIQLAQIVQIIHVIKAALQRF